MDHAFNRIQNLSTLKFLPDVKKDIKSHLKERSVNEIISEEMGLSKTDAQFMNYNADLERFTINQDGIRYVIQNISNLGIKDMERVIDIFRKQKQDVVLITQPPHQNERFLSKYEMIDRECQVYLGLEKKYKYGEQENVVYERVNNLR